MSVDDLVSALEDVHEAKQELEDRQSEYTGYSPSWALASWIEAHDKARQRLAEALNAYIDQRIAERSPHTCTCWMCARKEAEKD